MYKENKKLYTDDEYIVRMWEKEYIQDTAARFMLAWSNGERREAHRPMVQETHKPSKDIRSHIDATKSA
mgnify:CR=1 FL=1